MKSVENWWKTLKKVKNQPKKYKFTESTSFCMSTSFEEQAKYAPHSLTSFHVLQAPKSWSKYTTLVVLSDLHIPYIHLHRISSPSLHFVIYEKFLLGQNLIISKPNQRIITVSHQVVRMFQSNNSELLTIKTRLKRRWPKIPKIPKFL